VTNKHQSFPRQVVSRTLTATIAAAILGAALAYLPLCIWQGLVMTTEVSPWYGFLIVRILAGVLLSVLNIVILPFRLGLVALAIPASAALLSIPSGVAFAVTISRPGARLLVASPNKGIYLISPFLMLLFFLAYEFAFFAEGYQGTLFQYASLPGSPTLLAYAAFLSVVIMNFSYSIRAFVADHRLLPAASTRMRKLAKLLLDLRVHLHTAPLRLRLRRLTKRLSHARFAYAQVSDVFTASAANPPTAGIGEGEARQLVDMAAAISAGNLSFTIDRLRKSVDALSARPSVAPGELHTINAEIQTLEATLNQWGRLCTKFLRR